MNKKNKNPHVTQFANKITQSIISLVLQFDYLITSSYLQKQTVNLSRKIVFLPHPNCSVKINVCYADEQIDSINFYVDSFFNHLINISILWGIFLWVWKRAQ